MALKHNLTLFFDVKPDGASTVIDFDLLKDPHAIHVGGITSVQNVRFPFYSTAVAAVPTGSNYSASITGSVVTVTFAVAPAAGDPFNIIVWLQL